MSTFEIEVARYTVSMDWSNDYQDFRAIQWEGEGPVWSRHLGTLYFFEGHRPHGGAMPGIGAFRVARRRSYAFLNLHDFDGAYAILRSERPVFVRMSISGEVIEFLEIHSNSEPVGEVDTSPSGIVVGTGDVIGEIGDVVQLSARP